MKKILFSLSALLLLAACAPESVDRYHSGENNEDIISLLNERNYGKAIWLLESREGPNPAGEGAYLLAQSYLGRAGIEPLAFAADLTAPEPDTEAARLLFPKCPRGQVNAVKELEMKCLMKRVYLRAPEVDNSDFARARAHFRRAYPDPATSPAWVNTLIGMVETISLVKRAGDLFVYSQRYKGKRFKPNPTDLMYFSQQGKESFAEAKEALGRANYAGEKISTLLSGAKANEWFDRAEGTIEFAKTVGLSRFVDFVRENLLKPSEEIRFGESLDKLQDTLDLIDP